MIRPVAVPAHGFGSNPITLATSQERKSMTDERLPILIADDQRDVLEALRLLFKSEGHVCRTAGDPATAITALKNTQFSVALIDLNYTRDTTSGAEGLDLLEQ